jgi:hypothetical protein
MLRASFFKRQRFACTPDAPRESQLPQLMNAGDAWTDALIADLETLQNAAVDDGPKLLPRPKAKSWVGEMV